MGTSKSTESYCAFRTFGTSQCAAVHGIYTAVCSPSFLRSCNVLPDSRAVVTLAEAGKSVCVVLKSSAECRCCEDCGDGKIVYVSEEVLMILNLDLRDTTLRKVKISTQVDTAYASNIELTFLHYYDKSTIIGYSKNYTHSGYNQVKDWLNPNFKKEPVSSAKGSDNLSPNAAFWDELLNGKCERFIKSILDKTVINVGCIIRIAKYGILSRFEITKIDDLVGEVATDKFFLVSVSTRITISLGNKREQLKCHVASSVNKLCGLDKQLDVLKWQALFPLIFREQCRRYGIVPPGGVLLYGPPGCGKTHLVHWLQINIGQLFEMECASRVDVEFIMVQPAALIDSHVGGTEKKIDVLFSQLIELHYSKTIICVIDEIDILCQSRDRRDTRDRKHAALVLDHMDRINSLATSNRDNRNVLFIGITNDIDSVDLALRRPGRFDLEIEVGVPSSFERLEIFKSLLSDVNHKLTHSDIAYINDFCQAFVGADVKALITNASRGLYEKKRNTILSEMKASEQLLLTRDDFIEALKYTKPSALKSTTVEIPQVRWDDIGGYHDAKAILKECVEYPRLYGHLYEHLNLQIPRGILLYGPPGCSKTLLAKAVATESHMNFISVKGPELLSKWFGESERAIRDLFTKARVNSPCVIFFDEVDSIATSREVRDSGPSTRVLSQILNEMDGINSLKQVVVIAATNRPDLLDSALLRPGRLDRLIYIPLPDEEARRNIFKIYLGKLPLDLSNMDLDELALSMAEKTDGYSGAEIALICNEAAMNALREHIGTSKKSTESLNDKMANLKLANRVTLEHIKKALKQIKPRTSQKTIDFYENYRKQAAH